MKRSLFFWILALMICANVGCTDEAIYEPEGQERESMKEMMGKNLTHEVTQAEARENLEKFLLEMKLPSTRGGDGKLPPITSVYTRGKAAVATRAGETVEPYFHIFNFGDNEGFAIMSRDDRVEPLLAITFKGELTPETEIDNPGFELVYSRMEDYYVAKTMGTPSIDIDIDIDIPILPNDSLPPLPDPIETIDIVHLPMGPCPVQWGQTHPYNKYCIMYPEREPAYTGCAATAIAQLMSIYKYPSSYHHYPRNKTYYFNWDEMNLYTSNDDNNPFMDDSTKYDQIARLMELLGEPCNLSVTYRSVNQSSQGSLSLPENIPVALRSFGYSSGGDYVNYDTDLVVSELTNGYPVLLGGTKEGYGQLRWLGHGLLIRSMQLPIRNALGQVVWTDPVDSYYILCNWGNNGKDDGYFLSAVFDIDQPFAEGTRSDSNLPYNLTAFINIRK